MDISVSGNQEASYQYIRVSVRSPKDSLRRTPYGGKKQIHAVHLYRAFILITWSSDSHYLVT